MITEHKMKIRITGELYYNKETYFGIYLGVPVDKSQNEVLELDKSGKISLKGKSRPLKSDDEYVITFDGLHKNKNPRYDDYYQIKNVEAEKLETIEEQDKFLMTSVSRSQFKALKEAYPEHPLVKMILEDKIDTEKTKGIKGKTLASIKKTVKEKAEISLLSAKLSDLGLTDSNLERIMDYFKDGYIAVKEINKDIYSLCKIKGFGFLTVDQIAMRRGDDAHGKTRIEACFNYILKVEASDGHTWMMRRELVDKAKTLLKIDEPLIEGALHNPENKEWLYVSDERVALSKIRQHEINIVRDLNRIQKAFKPDGMHIVEKRLSYLEKGQGFDFTKQQREAILKSSRSGVSIINGPGGTGKTAVIKGVIASSGHSDNKVMTCALSGKASNVLSSRGMPSQTIHRALKYEGKGFAVNGSSETSFLPYSLIIVDEMSMVDASLFHALLRAVRNGSRIVLVGDNSQLSSVGYGDILQDLLVTNKFPSYELTEIHRQTKGSGVLEFATLVRNGEYEIPYDSSGRSSFGEHKDQSLITYSSTHKSSILKDALKIVSGMKGELSNKNSLLDFQVLTANRKSGLLSSNNLNVEMQKIINGSNKPSVKGREFTYKEGDKVIAIGNIYSTRSFKSVKEYKEFIARRELSGKGSEPITGKKDVFNGSMGTIESIDTEERIVFVRFEDVEGLIPYEVSGLDKISLAYAITVHRSQGSQYGKVLMCLDFSAYMLLSMNLVYTAVTRSSDKCIVLAESNALAKALKTKSNSRRTFLKELLSE